MFNEKSHPEHFEELCALAASGQISEAEFAEIQDHLQQCAHCRSIYSDFIDLVHYKLPLANTEPMVPSNLAGLFSEDPSYRERFLTRARKQGLAISNGPLRDTVASKLGTWLWPTLGYTQAATVAIALLLLTVGALGYILRRSNVRDRALLAEMAATNKRFSQQDKPTSIRAQENALATTRPAVAAPSGTDLELVKIRQEYAVAEERVRALQEQVRSASFELQASRAQLDEANGSRNQLETKLTATEEDVTHINDELQNLHDSRSKDAAKMAAQDLEIQQLSTRLNEQTESLEREKTLLAAGRDIHDLMGARNLHVVDVLDVDSKGKDKRAFGRVFYTDGKSLIFYAYDLGDRAAAKRNASFQVWGAHGTAQNPAQSLGVFYVDDQKQNRWVLKFDDSSILAEIDSVFVTVEPPGGSAKPTGQKLLYAYLRADANHP